MTVKIAIVGGGPASVSLCMQLFEKFTPHVTEEEVEISVFEKNTAIGPGLPYSIEEDCYVLNLPKEVMEPIQGQNGRFSNWLKSFPDCPQDTYFPPRYYFGKYLEYLANDVAQRSVGGKIKIKYHTTCEVLDLIEQDDQFEVVTTKGNYVGDYTILCTGHMPSVAYRHLIGNERYVHNPWKEGVFEGIPPDEEIAIIGTRLSAIDIALKLSSIGHQGKVSMVSRSGLLPAVLAKSIPPYPLKYLTLENFDHITKSGLMPLGLNELMKLFWKEISDAEGREFNLSLIDKSYKDILPLSWLNKEISHAEVGNRAWQRVLFSLYPIVPNIWSMMNLRDRCTFLKENHSLFLTYLAAFPLENAYKMRRLLQSNRLEVLGGLDSIECRGSAYHLKLADNRTLIAKHLINATGPGYDPAEIPMYRNLLHRGVVRKHHLGGFDVDPKTLQLFRRKHGLHRNMYAVGELTHGACLATTDMTRVAMQADRAATCIVRDYRQTMTTLRWTPFRYTKKLGLFKPHIGSPRIEALAIVAAATSIARYFKP
jgi:uncharacterized NAD(P)/FAD-binding protein YdhS